MLNVVVASPVRVKTALKNNFIELVIEGPHSREPSNDRGVRKREKGKKVYLCFFSSPLLHSTEAKI